jgi:LAS superfamily LD-carboxypeptidase LdcB
MHDARDVDQLRLSLRRRAGRSVERNPNPKWVAPPGTSLHRYGTELDLGPSAAYALLEANCRRFGLINRVTACS